MAGRIIGVDVGGTFTDVVAVDSGEIVTAKVPTNAHASDLSVLAGAREVEVGRADVFNLASTAGLNAVITRRLPKVAFLTTTGHRDMLDKGSIVRPIEALTDPTWRRGFGDAGGRPLVPRYLRREINERILANGEVFIKFDEEQARHELRVLRRCNIQGVAICLLNAYVDGSHERRLRELVGEELGDIVCSISSDVSPLIKEHIRASTTVIDLLMKLLYGDYTRRLQTGLQELGFKGRFNYADCRAMLLAADYAMEKPHKLVMGGPAGGTLASAHFGRMIEDTNLVCADVGGTSCDISLVIDGEPWSAATVTLEYDLVVNAMSTHVVTLGAGGGSIISVTPTGDIAAGPDSAGAEPGPACYGTGGSRPTVTDAALLMGILAPDRFLGGKKALFPDLSLQAFESLETHLPLDRRIRYAWDITLHNVAEGIIDIAIRRGIDPRDFSLVAFGAAGPMMLPCLLDQIPLRRVIIPPHPGLFSALGLASSDRVYSDHHCKYAMLVPEAADVLNTIFNDMEHRLLHRIGQDRDKARVVRTFDACLLGQSWLTPLIEVPRGPITAESVDQMVANFHSTYERLNHQRFEAIPVRSAIYRVEVIVPSSKVNYLPVGIREKPLRSREATLHYIYGGDISANEYERVDLGDGDVITGPAIIREMMSTTFVPRDRRAIVGAFGALIVE